MWIGSIQHRHLVYSLVARDLRAQYMGSFLGLAWLVLRPLAWMVTYSFALSMILQAKSGPAFSQVPFPIWLLTGMLPYMFFQEAANRAVTSIISQANLVKKSLFDKSVLPLCTVITTFANHCVGLLVLLAVMAGFRVFVPDVGVSFTPIMLLLPVVSAILFVYVLGWAYFLSAVQVYVRDTIQVVGVVLQLLFFLTPILYPESLIPGWALTLLKVNPHFFFVRFYRETLLLGQVPNVLSLAGIAAVSIVFWWFGKTIFNRLAPDFASAL
jgi:lipopolysaccharide transport system permease protein